MSAFNTFVSKFLRRPESSLETKKYSHTSSYTTVTNVGSPVWTPRQYDKLCKEGYQKNVVVYRCVSLIAKSIASVPWTLQKGYHQVDRHPLLTLLTEPNPARGGAQFIEALMSYLLLDGNAYAEFLVNGKGRPVEIHTLRPDRVKVVPGAHGVPAAYTYRVGEQERIIPVDPTSGKSRMLHLKLFHPLNDWYGMSPLEAAAHSIDQHNAVSGHNLAVLQNGGRPSGALIIGRNNAEGYNLSTEQRERLRENIDGFMRGPSNSGRILVMEGDMQWQEMGMSLKDLDFIEGKKLSAREIAQVFGVPPMLAGIPGDATFANFKEARFHLWEDTILPLLDSLTDELNRWLVPIFGNDLTLGHDPDRIPALSHRRETIWNRINQADFLTINEKRQAIGYGPIEGGNCFNPTYKN